MIEVEKFIHSVKLLNSEGVEKNSNTGFFVKPNLFLTAKHLLKEYENDDQIVIEIASDADSANKVAKIIYQDEEYDIILLELLQYRSEVFKGIVKETKLPPQGKYAFFSYSEGYQILGHWFKSDSARIIKNQTLSGEDYEFYLDKHSTNLQGASGSPIFLNDMIIGMVTSQTASPQIRSVLGIRNGLIKVAESYDFLENSWVLDDFERKLFSISKQFIYRNQNSRKYIPQIFIETDETKENYRFIAHPALLYNKAIETYQYINLDSMNYELSTMGLQTLKKRSLIELDHQDVKSIFEIPKKNKEIVDEMSHSLRKLDHSFGIKNENFDFTRAFFGSQYGLHFPLDDISEKLSTFNIKNSIIMADAGQGKTNFLCDFINTFLDAHSIPVMAFDVSNIIEDNILTSFEALRITLFGNDPTLFFSALEEMWVYRRKQLIIVIDGINEIKDPHNFENSIYSLIKRFEMYPYVRIIMSVRNELFKERFTKIAQDPNIVKFNLKESYSSNSVIDKRLFDGYMEFFNIKIGRLGSDVKKQLVSDKLLLRIFSETYGNETTESPSELLSIEHLNLAKLFNGYLNRQQERICINTSEQLEFDRILNIIIESMLKYDTFSEVTINELSSDQVTFLDKVVEESILYKLTTDVSEGIRTRLITKISFTYDEMRDFLIANHLLVLYEKDSELAVNLINKLTNEENNYPVTEGLRKYLFFASKETANPTFFDLIKSNAWYPLTLLQNIIMLDDTKITEQDLKLVKTMMFSFQGPYEKLFVEMIRRRSPNNTLKFGIHFLFKLLLDDSEESKTFFNKILAPRTDHWYRYTDSLGESLREFVDDLLNKDSLTDEEHKLLIPLCYLLGLNNFEFKSLSIEIEQTYSDMFEWGKNYLKDI